LGGGHICKGVWKKLPYLLCSSCGPKVDKTPTFGIPTSLNTCTKCHSKWITDGKCDKCGTVMEWLKTDRPWYKTIYKGSIR